MQAIIGAGLRERFSISEHLPTDLERLVKALNGIYPGAEQPKRASIETLPRAIKKTPSDLTLVLRDFLPPDEVYD